MQIERLQHSSDETYYEILNVYLTYEKELNEWVKSRTLYNIRLSERYYLQLFEDIASGKVW